MEATRTDWGGGCVTDHWAVLSSDRAFHEKVSPDACGVGVRHLYDPIWSNTNYWTSWDWGPSYANTGSNPELVQYDAAIYNN